MQRLALRSIQKDPAGTLKIGLFIIGTLGHLSKDSCPIVTEFRLRAATPNDLMRRACQEWPLMHVVPLCLADSHNGAAAGTRQGESTSQAWKPT